MDKDVIKQKLARLLNGIEIGFFNTAKDWGEETNDEYFKYFGDADEELRAMSILAFACMVGNWYNGPADVFYTNPRVTYSPPEPYYQFDDYLSAFLDHSFQIERDFPVMYSYIIYYLAELDKQKPFEHVFPTIEQTLFVNMRTLFASDEKRLKLASFNDLLREVGLPTFFLD